MSTTPSFTQALADAVAIKNTFIHFTHEVTDTMPRRPQSLPPSMRCSRGTAGGKLRPDVFSELEVSTNCTEDDISSVTGGSEHGNVSEEEVSPARPLEVLVPQPPEFRLSTSAKAWNPGAQMLPPRATRRFAQQLEQLVTMAKATLVTCAWIQSLEMKDEGAAGWSIVVRLLPNDMPYKEHVLTLAKAGLMQATGSATKLCMVGCHAQPFVHMPLGFAALFAGVADGQQACWSLLRQGFCHYGDRCRWEHPVYQRKVYVKVMLPDSW